jgi:hypothetical protein
LFLERAALNQLGGRFLTEFYAMVARWIIWSESLVRDWPADVRAAAFDVAAGEESVRIAESIDVLLGRDVDAHGMH